MRIHKYQTYGYAGRTQHLNKVYSVRLSSSDIDILNEYYPGESISFQVRSAINALRRHDSSSQGECNTSSGNM